MPGFFEALVVITAILVAVGIPVTGLVIRFALRPLVQDISNAIRNHASGAGDPAQLENLNRRLERIEQSLADQEAISTRLLEIYEFDRKLGSGRPDDPDSGQP